jgi:hypothetical protein
MYFDPSVYAIDLDATIQPGECLGWELSQFREEGEREIMRER